MLAPGCTKLSATVEETHQCMHGCMNLSATAEGIHLLMRYQPRLESRGDPKLIMEIEGATGRSRAPFFLISSCVKKYKMA